MNILIKQQAKGGQTKKFSLNKNANKIVAQPGDRIELIDSETGKLPEKTVIRRSQDKLVFDIDGEKSAFEVHGFFTECIPENSCVVTVNDAGADHAIFIAQSEEAAKTIGAAEALTETDFVLYVPPAQATATVGAGILWPYFLGGAGIAAGLAGGGGGSARNAHAPVAVGDVGIAVATGTKAGMPASGNVLNNDSDQDIGDVISVVAVSGGRLGTAIQGKHGVLMLHADGSYTYEINNADAEVWALGSAKETLTEDFTYIIQDRSGATSSASLRILIEGDNDAPAAANDNAIAGASGIVSGYAATGNVLLNDRDLDQGDSIRLAGVNGGEIGLPMSGRYGTLLMNPDGSYRYDVQQGNSVVDALPSAGSSVFESFTYTVIDQAGATSSAVLTIQIAGADNAPFAKALLPDQEARIGMETAPFNASAYFGDVDTGDVLTYRLTGDTPPWLRIDEKSGVLQGTPASVGKFQVSVSAIDTHGASVTHAFMLNVRGENHAPTATSDTGSATENGTASGTKATGNVLANDTDGDQGDFLVVSGISNGQIGVAGNGKYGSILLSQDGAYTYDVNNADPAVNALRLPGDTLIDTFTYVVKDTSGASTSSTLSITIHGANDAPASVAAIKDQTGRVGQPLAALAVKSNFADPDTGDILTYGLAPGAPSWLAIDPLSGSITGTPAAAGSYHVTVTVTDSTKAQTQSGYLLTVAPASTGDDTPPVPTVLTANPDTAIAVEAGTASPGANPSGNVLSNDAGGAGLKVVTAISGGSLNTGAAGNYGTLVIDSAGGYSYAVDNVNASVQALRTAADTLLDSFTYTVTDSLGATAISTLQITIQGANDAPVATQDIITVNRTATIFATANTGLLRNDIDDELNETLILSSIAQNGATSPVAVGIPGIVTTEFGTLTVNADGSYHYIANGASAMALASQESASESFTYTIADASGATASATITITIQGNSNTVPVTSPDSATAIESGAAAGTDATGNVLSNDSDPGDSMSILDIVGGNVQGATAGIYGTLTLNRDGGFVYKADDSNATVNALRTASDTLTDTFTYNVVDSFGAIAASTLTLTIAGANDAPIAVADAGVATEQGASGGSNATGNVLVNDTDVDAVDGKTVSAISGGVLLASTKGAHGSLLIDSKGDYTYVVDESDAAVNALWHAADTLTDLFTYTMTDTDGATSSTVLTITIQGSNDAPLVVDDVFSVERTQTYAAIGKDGFLKNDTDIDTGDTLSIVSTAQQSIVKTVGAATAGVIVSDYGTLTVNQDGSFTYAADGASSLALTSTDSAIDTFTYTVADSEGATTTATVSFTIKGNDNVAPVAVPDLAFAAEAGSSAGSAATGNVLANDTDANVSNTHTVEAIENGVLQSPVTGKYGALTLNYDGKFSYVIDDGIAEVDALRQAGDTLIDVFTYTMSDNLGARASSTLTVTITGSNDAPLAADNTGFVSKLSSLSVTKENGLLLNATDVDSGDALSVSAIAQGGTSQPVTAGTPGMLVSAMGQLTINQDGSYTYLANGTVSANLAAGVTAIDTFSYTVTDLAGATAAAVLKITVTGSANTDPVALPDMGTAIEGGAAAGTTASGNVLTNDSDADTGDTLSMDSITGTAAGSVGGVTTGAYGTLTLNADGSYSYVINEADTVVNALSGSAQTLTDVFTYVVKDLANASAMATLTITIQGANDAPTVQADAASADEAGTTAGSAATGNVLTNDIDADNGDSVAIHSIAGIAAGTVGGTTAGSYGTLTLNADGSYSYVVNDAHAAVNALSDPSQTLTDVFTYVLRDLSNAQSTATLTITIHGANDAPVAAADTATAIPDGVLAGSSATGNVLSNDTDGDALDSFSVTGVTNGSNGTLNGVTAGLYGNLTLNSDGTYSYAVDSLNATVRALYQDTLTDVFTYTLSDSPGAISSSTVTIKIQGADDAPVLASALADQTGKLNEALAPLNVAANFDPVDAGDPLTYSLSNAPAWLSIDPATGIISGTPASAGAYDITVVAKDGAANVAQDIYKLTIGSEPLTLLASQPLSGEKSLDVTSPLVLKFSEDISLGSGQIRIMDDMGTSGFVVQQYNVVPSASMQDKYDNDVVLTLDKGVITGFTIGGIDKFTEVGASVSVMGSMLIINPSGDHSAAANTAWNFDWDFGAKYHIELDAGVVTGTATGTVNEAIVSATALAFTTVAPNQNGSATPSYKMNVISGAMESSYFWHNGHLEKDGVGYGTLLDFGNGAHAIVVINQGYPSRNAPMGGEVIIKDFGFSGTTLTADDLIYNDNLGDMSMITTESTYSGKAAIWGKADLSIGDELNRSLSGTGNSNHRINFNQTDHESFFSSSNGKAITSDPIFEDATHYNANVIVFG